MSREFSYILGLDLGVASIGWAIVPENEELFHKLKLGVRIFKSAARGKYGAASAKTVEEGRDKPLNQKRRERRASRRLLDRRRRRKISLLRHLQTMGLLPECDHQSCEARNRMFDELDRELRSLNKASEHREEHLLPYILRARGVREPLTHYELGRAIYHLGQRRGFLSNRKVPMKKEDSGKVYSEIEELKEHLQAGCTLAEYFCTTDPEKECIRGRYTSRQMYLDEFQKIWEYQSGIYPEILTEEWKEKIHKTIFYQRPLKSQKDKIGVCRLEKGRKRARMASLGAQQIRYWQKILDLEYQIDDELPQPLREDEQTKLAAALEQKERMTFAEIKKLLKLPKSTKFNLERGGENSLPGNRTGCRIRGVLQERWDTMSPEKQKELADELLQFDKEEACQRRLENMGYAREDAVELSLLLFEEGYYRLSNRAISKILDRMVEKRIQYKTAEEEIYGEDRFDRREYAFLPPLLKTEGFGDIITNPIVLRTLSEMRKVVNAIIREYGLPKRIVVELARSLKKGRKLRAKESERMNEKKRDRERIRKILVESGIAVPSQTDILKYQLAEECQWQCPYTGRRFTINNLYGPQPEFDIEHILPLSKSLDNSFRNKTLCYWKENRTVKKGNSPYEAYHKDPERYQEVRTWCKVLPPEKQKLFIKEGYDTDFSSRMLNDTAYMSRYALQYLALLYGGIIEPGKDDKKGEQKIYTSNGAITGFLRNEWGMNQILNQSSYEKTRTDHRHHAVDAVVIAFCSSRIKQELSRAAQLSESRKLNQKFISEELPHPRKNFIETVRKAVEEINVSFRCDKQVSGEMHDETFWTKPHVYRDEKGNEVEKRHKKIAVGELTLKKIEAIADGGIRRFILSELEKHGGDLDKLKAAPLVRRTSDGREIPIRNVRCVETANVEKIGKDSSVRYVATDAKHHAEVFAYVDKKGVEKWKVRIVSIWEAYKRQRAGMPVICRNFHEKTENRKKETEYVFKFSLFKDDCLLLNEDDGSQSLYRVIVLENTGTVRLQKHTDARSWDGASDTRIRKNLTVLCGKVQKVTVDLLGNIHPAEAE